MRSSLAFLAFATLLAFACSSPVMKDEITEEGSGNEPEIVIKEVVEEVEESVGEEVNEDEKAAAVDNPSDLLTMEMNPEENEIKVNEKVVDGGSKKPNKRHCQKCLKAHYRARHDAFCGTCDAQSEQEKLPEKEKPVKTNNRRCEKCARKNFRARHEEFCSAKCNEAVENEADTSNVEKVKKKKNTKVKVVKEEDTKEVMEEEDVVEVTTVAEVDESTVKKQVSKKNKKHRNKDKKNKKKKKKDQTEKVEDEESEDAVEEEDEEKKTPVKLGPLESLIRFLIKTNTYTR